MLKKWLSTILRLSYVLLAAKAQGTEGHLLLGNEVGITLKSLMFLPRILIQSAYNTDDHIINVL
jgi:hypothetical protein